MAYFTVADLQGAGYIAGGDPTAFAANNPGFTYKLNEISDAGAAFGPTENYLDPGSAGLGLDLSSVLGGGGGILSFIPGIMNAVVAGAGEAPTLAAAFGDKKSAQFLKDQQAPALANAAAQQAIAQSNQAAAEALTKAQVAQAQSASDIAKTVAPWFALAIGFIAAAKYLGRS